MKLQLRYLFGILRRFVAISQLPLFWNDFSVADAFGTSAVADTFKRAFEEWKGNYKYLTELVMVLNHKIWQWFEKNAALAAMYNDFWEIADQYALNNLKGEELDYFYRVTD